MKVAGIMSQGGAAVGMGAASKVSRKIVGVTTGAAVGGIGRIGRGSFGQIGQRVADNEKLKDWAATSSVGRGILRSSRAIGNASFDARSVAGAGEKAGIGAGAKGGYKTRRDEIVKKEQAFAKSLGTLDEDDTKVHQLMTEEESMKSKVASLKVDLKSADPQHRADYEDQIREAEAAIKEQGIKISREKNRRQIGTAGDIEGLIEEKTKKDAAEAKLKKLKGEFKLLTATKDKVAMDKEIKDTETELKKIKIAVKEKTGTSGYAGALENRGVIASAIFGRINNQDTTAGKEIRKTYEKEVKKTKEDKKFDGLREAFEKKAE